MGTQENRSGNRIGIIIGIFVALCCLCLVVAGMAGFAYSQLVEPTAVTIGETPNVVNPPISDDPTSKPPNIERPNVEQISDETLSTLERTVVPQNDPRELACRLNKICNIPETMATSDIPRVIGDQQDFWVHNLDSNTNNQVHATLQYITPHAYFWVQDNVNFSKDDAQALMDAFENKIYPTDREFFGSEWTPGIDGDVHIYILYARGLGSSIGGYFSSGDERSPLISQYSNAHEMFFFNSDTTQLNSPFTYGVLAHEFQHMIHWYHDVNETAWINEGFSDLAMTLNGYPIGGHNWSYIADTDLQLNDWPNGNVDTTPHYGAAYLFLRYFLSRFGEDATKLLVQEPANGLEGVDHVLNQINAVDPITNQPITTDSFFMDWAVTNLVVNKPMSTDRYTYKDYPDALAASATETINQCPQESALRTVHQYGVDYIAITCEGEHTIHFSGSTVTKLVPADPYSGSYDFWSNKGDESDMTLTREFDFTNVNAPIELSYQTWFDIEKDWDYVYLEASEDGENWDILLTPSGTGANPIGNSYGWGYTGVSNDWITEKVDLSNYAGKKVFIRFEYVTDTAVNGEGFLLDDVSVDAAGYRSDFEADDGGWVADGFVRVKNALPQTFGLSLVLPNDSTVTAIQLTPDQTADIPISLQAGDTAYLVVSGLTRFTRELASYQFEIR